MASLREIAESLDDEIVMNKHIVANKKWTKKTAPIKGRLNSLVARYSHDEDDTASKNINDIILNSPIFK